jgi:predicted GNAT family acetyltransferase
MEIKSKKGYVAVKILLIDGVLLRRWTSVLDNYNWELIFSEGLKLDLENLDNITRSRSVIRFSLKRPLNLEKHFKSTYFSCKLCSGTEELLVEGRIENLEGVKDVVNLDEENVVHYVRKKEFSLRLTPIDARRQQFGILCYEDLEDGSKNLFHTEIPPNHRGKDLGKILAQKAVSELGGSKLQLTCDFLLHLYSKHKHDIFKDSIVTV